MGRSQKEVSRTSEAPLPLIVLAHLCYTESQRPINRIATMGRPCQPFDQSLQSVILALAERQAAAHPERRGRLPTRYRLWRDLCAQGHRCAWSTFRYHFDKLVAAGRIIPDDGLYWLPGRPITPPPTPRRPKPIPRPSAALQPALF